MTKGAVATDLRDQLQKSLGSAYTLERELGGGGMSRVFLAREAAFDRPVVVKVLPPDLAGVSVDRFKREIQLAARLQHPHIVPLLSAGETEGLPYYTMPFVQGESLRKHLATQGALPISECVRLLRDIASALSHAHKAGVVHRDIKPDNVMLSGGSATVLDFGVAKAVRDAAGKTSHSGLTSLGIALGTPAYMAPEQAAADPNVDHRADIYAFGVLAYEMITGRTPFGHRPANELLVAHLTEMPAPVDGLRPDCPPDLAQLVMACLRKKQSERPHSAEALMTALDELTTPSGGTQVRLRSMWTTPTGAEVPGSGRRTLIAYSVVAVVGAVLAKGSVILFALPDWVFGGAGVVLALGLVLMSATAYAAKRRREQGIISGPGTTPFLSWRRAGLASAGMVVAYTVFVSGFVLLRALGIGPGASLMAAGMVKEQSRLIVTDFNVAGSDSSLGSVVTEALRTDLSQTRIVSLIQSSALQSALARMQRAPGTKLDLALARELAQREGIATIVDGDVATAGSGYVFSARLINAQSGDVLAAVRETADDATKVIPAIDRLSRELRHRIGESLRSIRAQPPLDQVTTSSLDALRRYAQGVRAIEVDGDYRAGIPALEDAVRLDTTFAMAYRKLGVSLSNLGLDPARARLMLERAYAFRERLPTIERLVAEGSYFMSAKPDDAKALAAFGAVLELDPNNRTALINSSVLHLDRREYATAESLLVRSIAVDSARSQSYVNLTVAQVALGKMAAARRTIATLEQRFPANAQGLNFSAQLSASMGQYDSAAKAFQALAARPGDAVEERLYGNAGLGSLASLQGRLRDAAREFALAVQAQRQFGATPSPLTGVIGEATFDVWYRERPAEGLRKLEAALAAHPLSADKPLDRPYLDLVTLYAWAGRPSRARELLAEFDAQSKETSDLQKMRGAARDGALGEILIAEKRYPEAIEALRRSDQGQCRVCVMPRLGVAYDLSGQRDSAIAIFERYRNTPELFRLGSDGTYLAGIDKRLGELYEAKGDKAKALAAYEQFVALWRNADAELEPKVREVQKRISTLRGQVPA